jgi:hypothetical protein
VLGWVVAITVGWCALAVVVAVVLGRVVRLRDRQVPAPGRRPPGVPAPRTAPDPAPDRDLERG